MKKALTLLIAATFVVGVTSQAQANPISITPSTAACGTATCLALFGNENGQAQIDAAIDAVFPGLTSTEVYKQNVGGSEVGSAAAWYTTTFNADTTGGTVTWNGPGFISGNPLYFLVKDGNATPNWYLFDISNWAGGANGTKDTITFSGFFPNQGAISHVTIYGTTTNVPDGGSVAMLLGAALVGLAGLRRFVK